MKNVLFIAIMFLYGGTILGASKNNNEIDDLKKQVEHLKQENERIKEQIDLDVAWQTQITQYEKKIADLLKEKVAAQAGFTSESAKASFAELSGIKDGIGDSKMPDGLDGTIKVAAGAEGTSFLRSKAPMLSLLSEAADTLIKKLPDGAVIVTNRQIEQAYQAVFVQQQLNREKDLLSKLISKLNPPSEATFRIMELAPVVAGAYTMGLVLETVNSLSKLFRVDRVVNTYTTDAETLLLLGFILDGKQKGFVINVEYFDDSIAMITESFMRDLNELIYSIHQGNKLLEKLKSIPDTVDSNQSIETKTDMESLESQLKVCHSMVEGLDPNTKAEVFWKQIKGLHIGAKIKDRKRLMLEAKSQVIQITETRKWRGDKIQIGGEIQLAYRIIECDGKVSDAGILLKANNSGKIDFSKLENFDEAY